MQDDARMCFPGTVSQKENLENNGLGADAVRPDLLCWGSGSGLSVLL